MKKTFIFFIALVCFGLFAKAQTTADRKLELYLGIGGFPNGEASSADLTFELHTRPPATDNFSFGARLQWEFASRAVYSSFCLTADYYFSRPENGLRIFAGAGLGGFNELNATTSNSFFDLNYFDLNHAKFGFFPRMGVEVWRFRLSAEYNLTGGTDNYAAVNLGFFFGGGRKK